jgi:16S rRNA (guanine966-N2)-methyltransferase
MDTIFVVAGRHLIVKKSAVEIFRQGASDVHIGAGWAKGMTLKSPDGGGTRPTSAKIRAAVMNILSGDLSEARVLDLCAGSGALAFEALSRGAESAVLIDSGQRAIAVLKANAQGLSQRASTQGLPQPKVQIRSLDVRQVERAFKRDGEFSLIFFDPPYAEAVALLEAVIPTLAKVLCPGGVLVFESDAKAQAEVHKVFLTYDNCFTIESERSYGDTALTIASRSEGGQG